MILQSAAVTVSASGTTTLVTGISGKRIQVYSLVIIYTSGTTPVLTLQDGSTALTGAISLPATSGQGITFNLVKAAEAPPWFICSQGNNFVANVTGTTPVLAGYVQYTIT